MAEQSSSPSRIDGIDILRGFSIFFVLMNHVHMRLFLAKISYTTELPAQLASSLVWNGQRGVQIFFCISGFLIASTSIRRWGALAKIKPFSFYWLRIARIVPLLAILLAILSLLHILGLQDFVISEKSGGLSGALAAALTFRINVLEANLGYLPASWDILWSLSVEETFYLFFPIVCVFLGRSKFFYLVLALFIILGPFGRTVLAHGNEVWEEYSYLGSMDAISFGVLAAILSSRLRFSSAVLKWFSVMGILLLIFTLGFTRTVNQLGLSATGIDKTILAIGVCLLIIAAAQTRWRASRWYYPLLKLGERSYEIYLTHMFVIFAFFNLFLWFGSPIEWIPGLFVVSILVSTLLGEIVGRFYSEPLNSMLRKRRKKKVYSQTDVSLHSIDI